MLVQYKESSDVLLAAEPQLFVKFNNETKQLNTLEKVQGTNTLNVLSLFLGVVEWI